MITKDEILEAIDLYERERAGHTALFPERYPELACHLVELFNDRMKPKCKIINGAFNWILEVDGQSIPFNYSSSADYFAELYTRLGYEVQREVAKEDSE